MLLLLYIINCRNIDMCRSWLCIGLFDITINCGIVRPYNYYLFQVPFVSVVSNWFDVCGDQFSMLNTVDMEVYVYCDKSLDNQIAFS